MRKLLGPCLLLLAAGIGAQAQETPGEFPKLTGPYLGQKVPGLVPEVFARGVVSTEAHEFSCSFTPDGKEFYFTRSDPATRTPRIMVTRIVEGAWTKPEMARLTENGPSFEPRVTADGKRIDYTYGGIVPGRTGPPMNVFYADREGAGWGEPRAVDLGTRAGLPLVTPDGKFLFFTGGARGKSDIDWVDARILDALRPTAR